MRSLILFLAACAATQTAPEPPVPEPTPAEPLFADTMAIETEVSATDRKHTRDAEAIREVLAALGDRADWTTSGMPRCMPKLWARLVPPSGEGGATFLFCSAEGSGHIWVPGEGGFALPEAASRALYDATMALELEHAGAIAPTAVTDHLDTLMLTATIAPAEGAAQGLRGVNLYTGQRLEPDAQWEDGSPVAVSFQLEGDQAKNLVDALALSGFFQRGKTFHSPTGTDSKTPPPGSTEGPAPSPAPPAGWVGLTVTTADWHRTWHEHNALPIFESTLAAIEQAGVSDEAAAALDELATALK